MSIPSASTSHGLTGRNADREGLRQALAACRDGDTFVVTKLDRLARSVRGAHQIADDLAAREVKLSIAGSVYDPTDPMGKLLFNVLAMVAEFEADLIRARTREGMKVAKAKGRLRGKSPKLTPGKKLTSSSYMLPTSTPGASWLDCSAWAAPRSTAPFSAPSAGARTPCSRCVVDARARWRILRLHVEDQVPLARLARETDVGLRTLERWHARYRADGYAGLETASRADTGSRRLPPDLVHLIQGLALSKPRPAIATIHRKVTGICAARRWPVPSYSVVWDIVRTLDPGMVTLALEGAASYRDKHELVLRRQAELPNAMWQSDHTMLDILVVGTDGKPARPWLTTILDDCSRAVCGYTVFLGAPSAMNTALVLRQAIWHKTDPAWPMCGLPDVLYVDHGSDFTSDQLAHTAIDLHIRLIHSTVARPQGRGKIERFFGTINTELLATLPGHITEGHPWPTPKLSLAALDSALDAFVATYNDRTHSELGTSPRSAWIADGWLPRMPKTLEDLDRLLLTVAKTRVVRRDGIRFQGLRYVSPTLAGYVGRSVVIRYDPRDITEIRVFDHAEFVCKAVNQEHHDQKVSLKEIQAARNGRRRALRAGINERIALVVAPTETPRITEAPTPAPRSALKIYKEDFR